MRTPLSETERTGQARYIRSNDAIIYWGGPADKMERTKELIVTFGHPYDRNTCLRIDTKLKDLERKRD